MTSATVSTYGLTFQGDRNRRSMSEHGFSSPRPEPNGGGVVGQLGFEGDRGRRGRGLRGLALRVLALCAPGNRLSHAQLAARAKGCGVALRPRAHARTGRVSRWTPTDPLLAAAR